MSEQGYSYLAQGCTQCSVWIKDKQVRAALVIRGKFWCCPVCDGSYGDVAGAAAASTVTALEGRMPPTARSVVAELVACKELKERMEALGSSRSDRATFEQLSAEYEPRKGRAWASARAWLTAFGDGRLN